MRSRLTSFTPAVVALACCAIACSASPDRARSDAAARGDRYAAQKKYPEAAIEYAHAVEKAPSSGEARLKLAESSLESGDVPKGIQAYYRAADLLPDRADVQLRAGGLALVQGHFDDARGRAERVLAKDPNNVDAQILRANAMAGLRDVDSAITNMEDAVKLSATQGASYTTLGDLHLLKGNNDAAEAAFRHAVDLQPTSARARLSLASYYWAAGRLDDANRALHEALARTPDNVAVNRALALLAVTRGNTKEAEGYLKTIARVSNEPSTRFLLADYYASAGRTQDATALLNVLQNEPGSAPLAKARLAELQRRAGHQDIALQMADDVLKSAPASVDTLLVKARVLAGSGKASEAERAAKRAVEAEPQNVTARFLLGTIYVQEGNADAARGEFSQVQQLNPDAVSAGLALASLEISAGNMQQASRFAEDAARAQPGDPTIQLLVARTRLARGDADGAATVLKDLVKTNPRAAGVQATYGAVLMTKGDVAGARAALTAALAADPNHLEALSSMLTLDLVTHHAEDAVARIDRRVKDTPRSVPLLVLAARTHATANDLPGAEGPLRRALDLDANNLDTYAMLAQVYTAEHRLPEARRELENLLSRKPDTTSARTLLGMLYELDGMRADAAKAYETVLASDPRSPIAANNLASLLLDDGKDLQRALQLATTAKQRLPQDAHVNDTLGWAYQRNGQNPEAVRALEESLGENGRNASALYHLSVTYDALGNAARARELKDRAVALNPALARR